MIMSRKLKIISITFMLITSIQLLCGLNATVEAAQSHSIYDVQEKLTEKGYDPGPNDGVLGIKTSEALKKFQKDNDLPVSAKLDIETEKKLFEESKGDPDHTEDSAISSESATTEMAHTQPDYFVPDHRIRLEAQVEDSEGVKLVRCYFKAAGEADLVFVPMRAIGSDKYIGVLPAPSGTTDQIEYLFLSVNNAKKVVRTQTFTMTKDVNQAPPAWQESAKGEIKVSMELDKVPTELRGFSDNVTIDAVESGARFGVVALLYHNISTTTVSSSTTATGATSGGTITAGTAGWSTAAIVGVGVGAAAVVGGIAAASGGGGGSGGSDAEELTETTILGDWNFRGNRRDGVLRTGNITFNDNGTHIYSVKDDGQSDADNADGTWFLSGTDLTITFQTMSTWVGAVSGDSRKFTLDTSSGSNHGTYRFTR